MHKHYKLFTMCIYNFQEVENRLVQMEQQLQNKGSILNVMKEDGRKKQVQKFEKNAGDEYSFEYLEFGNKVRKQYVGNESDEYEYDGNDQEWFDAYDHNDQRKMMHNNNVMIDDS